MDSQRQEKIARLLQKEMGEIFLLHAKNSHGTLISVSNVRITPDLSIAYVYISIFPSERAQNILSEIQEKSREFRYELGKRVRHQLRIVPELHFYLDDSLDYLENIDKLLKK